MDQLIETWTLLQTEMAKQVLIPKIEMIFHPNDLILTLDIQYEGDKAYIAGDVQRLDGTSEGIFLKQDVVTEAYIPQFFAFREGPLLQRFVATWRIHTGLKPDVVLIDGHGTAHPRQLGVASWFGVMTDLTTVGCAKDTLVHYEGTLADEKDSILPILNAEKELIGHLLRTQKGVKPNFVSSGHRVHQTSAIDLVKKIGGKYRIPESLRRADIAARFFQKTAKNNEIVPNKLNVDGKNFKLMVI
ncbi:MAG: endonuclease [Bacteroidota bacterium]|jgi:deoxyribonuclease V